MIAAVLDRMTPADVAQIPAKGDDGNDLAHTHQRQATRRPVVDAVERS